MKVIICAITALMLAMTSCEKKPTVVANDYVVDTLTAHGRGEFSEWSGKAAFLNDYGKKMEDYFETAGYDYRLDECKSAWKVFRDGDWVIIVGSVAKSHPEGFMFSWVIRIDGQDVDWEFLRLGDKPGFGTYPSGVLPYK